MTALQYVLSIVIIIVSAIAVKYYSPIYFYAQKWLFNGELTEERKESFRIDAYKHIQMFFGEIGGYNG